MVQLKSIKDPTYLLASFNFSQKTPKSKCSSCDFACLFDLFSGSKLTSIYFIFRSVIPRRPKLNIKYTERFSSRHSAEREAIKYSENFGKFSNTGSRFLA